MPNPARYRKRAVTGKTTIAMAPSTKTSRDLAQISIKKGSVEMVQRVALTVDGHNVVQPHLVQRSVMEKIMIATALSTKIFLSARVVPLERVSASELVNIYVTVHSKRNVMPRE